MTKKLLLLNKSRTIPTTKKTEGGQSAAASVILTFGLNLSTQSSKPPKTNSTSNDSECLCLTTDLPTSEKSSCEMHPGNSQLAWTPKTFNIYREIAELEQLVHVAATTCTGTRWCSTKSKTTTHEMCNRKQTTKAQIQNATTFQWSAKTCQIRREIGFMHQTFPTQFHDANLSPVKQRESRAIHVHRLHCGQQTDAQHHPDVPNQHAMRRQAILDFEVILQFRSGAISLFLQFDICCQQHWICWHWPDRKSPTTNCAVQSKDALPKTAQLCAEEKIAFLQQPGSNRPLFVNSKN